MNDRAQRQRILEVRNPYDGRVVGTVPRCSAAEVRRAIAAAHACKPSLSRHERSAILQKAAGLLRMRLAQASELITQEAGISRKDSAYEVGRACDLLDFAAMQALRDDGEAFACDLTPHGRKRRVYTRREPLAGVISAITAFNHPLNHVAHKVAPAVATNNRMVLKPSEKAPLSALYFAEQLYEAGLPRAMLRIVTGDPREIAAELVTNELVDLVTFTGSTAVGKAIAAKAGYRRLVLALGGNDPLIVMEDADLEEASTLAAQGSYRNSGQRCTAVKRILVHKDLHKRFVDLLVAKTEAWTFGDPMNPKVEMGTVIDEHAAKLFESRVNEAIAQGARLLAGNRRDGALYSPTVIDHVTPEMELVKEETFGPVSPVIRFSGIDEAIAIANGTAYGLSSAVCTNRLDYINRFVAELQAGSVNIREVPGYRLELAPFGGIKDSGLGHKEGVQESMKGFTNLKTFSLPTG